MKRYSPYSRTFLEYADQTINLLGDVLTRMEKREGQNNPDGRWSVLCVPTGVSTYLMAEGVIFGPAMAAFAADVLNYKYTDVDYHYDALTTINRMKTDLADDRDLWSLPETFTGSLLVKHDLEKNSRLTDEFVRFALNYARVLLYCDGKGLEFSNDVLWKLATFYTEEYALTLPFKKYHSRTSFCIINYLEIASIDLVPTLTQIVKEQPTLAAQYETGMR